MKALRIAVVGCLAAMPAMGVVWTGCSSNDSTPPKGVDIGTTFGAEVQITVVGRGRVLGSLPGLDCPSACFAQYTNATGQANAAQAVSLKAIPTPGARFLGWKVGTEEVGARGLGPDGCNPVVRAASQPAIDANALQISLPFAEVEGKPPAGQAAACQGYTKVPALYRLTATFEGGSTISDAGSDTGGDSGTIETLFQPPVVGAVAKEIGVASSYLYWRWESGGNAGISYAPAFGGTANIAVSATQTIPLFDVYTNGAVFQSGDGTVSYISSGSGTPIAMSGNPGTCVALAVDGTGVYCRTAGPNGNIVSWTLGGTGPTTLFTGVPQGTDLAVDSTTFYLSDTSGGTGAGKIVYTTRFGDGGAALFSTILTGRNNPSNLRAALTTRLMWLELDTGLGTGTAWANSSRLSSTAFTAVPSTSGLKAMTPDTSTSYMWVATSTSIAKAFYAGSDVRTFRSGLSGVGGVAVDSSYAYWTQSDGRVYRASRIGF